tara:strand:+ start:1143 stop:2060 length:918 start_codon:yes stop_codon:yes gene_type:complete
MILLKFFLKCLLLITILISEEVKLYNLDNESFADITTKNNLTFTCRVSGLENSGETVILLHGFPSTSHMWHELIDFLSSQNYRVIAPNQRGYSKGARPLEISDYHIDNLVQDVIDIADAMNLNEFHLIGHDWGSAVGWAVTAANKDIILSWTALSVPHLDAFGNAIINDKIQQDKSYYIDIFRMKFIPELYFKFLNYRNLKKMWSSSSDIQIEKYMNVFGQRKAITSALNWYRANDFNKGIGDIYVPTLMIYGLNDAAIAEKGIDETEKYIKAPYTLKKLNVSHWIVQESFDEVSVLILNHIQNL